MAVDPITIGELTDVPAAGSPLASTWSQEVTNRIVHRYANKAALDTWTTAPVGAYAQTMDDAMIYRRYTGGWAHQLPRSYWTAGIVATPVGGTTRPLARVTVPADPGPRFIVVRYTVFTSCPTALAGFWNIWIGGASIASYGMTAPAGGVGIMVNIHGVANIAAGVSPVVEAEKPHTTFTSGTDPNTHSMMVTVYPGQINVQTTPTPP